jgi:Lrp/AsnC family transcriptional regulator for asnA, asnC and gidA
MSIDMLDLRIIQTLNRNARMSYKAIAEELDVSDVTVRNRVRNMLEDGVIKRFNVLLDYHKLGRIIKAFIGLRVQPPKLKEIVEHLIDNPDVQVLYRTTGDVDLFVEVIFKDMEELNGFLESEMSLDGVTGTVVNVVIGPYKRCPCTGL